MKKIIFLSIFLLLHLSLYAQNEGPIVVKKGTSLLDYFTIEERYLYPEFTSGSVLFKTNVFTERKFNYNYLNGEIEFLQSKDTFEIRNKKDIKSVIIAQDTFYYDNGYILQIKSGHPKVGLKESIEFKDYVKKDGYGSTGSAGARTSYGSIATEGSNYKLKVNEDVIYKRTKLYYILSNKGEFVLFNKKNVNQLFPNYKSEIKTFLKTNKIKFDSEEDLLKLVEYLEGL